MRRFSQRTWIVPFFVMFGGTVVAFAASVWLDADHLGLPVDHAGPAPAAGSNASPGPVGLGVPFDPDIEWARSTLGGLGEVMAAILGLALTVSSIIVQLAATRFSPSITSLFLRARTNQLVLGYFVTSTLYVLWVNAAISNAYVPRWGVVVAMAMMTTSLLLLFPYFAYVLAFLDPDEVVGRLMRGGMDSAMSRRSHETVVARQERSVKAVEQLANLGLNALQQKDKGIAANAVDALLELVVAYGTKKGELDAAWYAVPDFLRQSPDFVSLSDEAVADLRNRRTWLEWKVLRQYQMLFGEGIRQIKDICYLVCIDTRRLGEAAAARRDLDTLDLSIKFFNTYVRATLNASDVRTAYNVLHQYRQLAESTVVSADPELRARGLSIARFLRYYSGVAYPKGLQFLTEVIAHDIAGLCELAWKASSPVHDELLEVFLTVDDPAEGADRERVLRGVRRAQVKLATTYLTHGATEYVARIQADMRLEPADRLCSIWRELSALVDREFWEVNDRGTNFDYLSPSQKACLGPFFSVFPGVVAPAATLPPGSL